MKLPNLVIAGGLLLFLAQDALADQTFILATGRRDPRIYAIDFGAALQARNNNTPNAIVSRSKVHPDRLDGTPVGDPANIVLSEDHRTAYVVNHHGPLNNAEFLQHGGRGSISVMDVRKMLQRNLDNTDRAVEHNFDSGYFGAVGLLVLPDLLAVSHSENWLTEDGSNRISLIDRKTGGRRGQIEMALGHPPHDCPAFPVPFVSPTPPPVVPFSTPDPQFGCWPDPEFLALGHGSDGKTYLFSGNAGTNDVSVMDLQRALAGAVVVEIAPRIPVQAGPFGIKASPDGKLIAVTARERGDIDFEGNTISIIDVDLARMGAHGAELARVRVGTDDPNAGARPFTLAWTPDGREIVVANFRTNNVSIVDLRRALAHDPHAEVARISVPRPDGLPGRPKGTAVTSDGRYAVVSGGPRLDPAAPPSGTVWIIDLRSRAVVATVTGVGNDPYGLTLVEGDED
ncbi:MAG TPA: YncE family protein [Burkholderiales bacterium]|jgi:DNA-binding beta-propeller fold protein YncE|nr:YncE family protein [Burkholderiales bacterium]